jgi:phage terminase Nu1 subunit (DNA packaging protein)
MYSTKSVNGFPVIQRDGRSVLSVWDQDWEFAYWLCQLLNELDENSERLLNEFDQNWPNVLDHAFTKKVHHA